MAERRYRVDVGGLRLAVKAIAWAAVAVQRFPPPPAFRSIGSKEAWTADQRQRRRLWALDQARALGYADDHPLVVEMLNATSAEAFSTAYTTRMIRANDGRVG